jgi:glycosyltransferase involved in cell wall biosynthesis
MVLISIITVCFNTEKTIEKTIQSVISQKSQNYEYIVIDGKSTDSTISVVQKYQDKISKFISEPDKGIYDAMNKGISQSTGDVIYFLNSGDYLNNENIVEDIISIFNVHPDYKIIYGNYIKYSEDKKKFVDNCEIKNILELIRKGICHQTIFSKREILESCNGFDLNYKMYSDLDWLLKIIIDFDVKINYTDKNICYSLQGGVCMQYYKLYAGERLKIIKKYLNKIDLTKNIINHSISFLLLALFIISRLSYSLWNKNCETP